MGDNVDNRVANIAEASILEKYNAEKLPATSSCSAGISYKGWIFRSGHSNILKRNEIIDLAKRISVRCDTQESDIAPDEDAILIGDKHLHIPPMIFGNDVLEVSHSSSNIRFNFSAEDALTAWATKHGSDSTAEKVLGPGAKGASLHLQEVPKVPFASEWAQGRSDDRGKDIELNSVKWDWTFNTDYVCSMHHGSPITADTDASSTSKVPSIVSARQLSSTSATSDEWVDWSWRISEEGSGMGIDRILLSTREDILFYDESLLYQDDLEDCGEVTVNAKLRVMPSCWFALIRTFTRIDGASVSIRDARLFHKFGESHVSLEVTWRELEGAAYTRLTKPASALNDEQELLLRQPPTLASLGGALHAPYVAGSPTANPPGAGVGMGTRAVPPRVPGPTPPAHVFQAPQGRVLNVLDANALCQVVPTVNSTQNIVKDFHLNIEV